MSTRRFSRKPETEAPVQARGVVHHLVASTAKELARAIWEEAATTDNEFRKTWPTMEGFVRARWQSFIKAARDSLADALHPDNHSLSTEHMRAQIHEALLLNAGVNPAANLIDQYIDGKPN